MRIYGSENWVVNASESRNIETVEMLFLRLFTHYDNKR
jgi:hypothetical protein